MHSWLRRNAQTWVSLALAVALAIAPSWSGPAPFTVEQAWARPGFAGAAAGGGVIKARESSPPRAGNSAVYFLIRNAGSADDRLVAASSPVAARTELHLTTIKNGVASMRTVPEIFVPAGGATRLRPGGVHIMLVRLNRDLKVGDKIPLELRFQRGGAVKITVEVKILTH